MLGRRPSPRGIATFPSVSRATRRGVVRTSYPLIMMGSAIIVVLAVLVAWWTWPTRELTHLRLPPQTLEDVLQKRMVGIGLLENQTRLDEASQLFEELGAVVPTEPLPIQNLAIARLLALKENRDRLPELVEVTRQAIDSLLQFSPRSIAAHWLAADMLGTLPGVDEDERARQMMDLLSEAAEEHPDSVPLYFAMHNAAQTSFDEELAERARVAIRRAHELAPRNLSVLLACLESQAESEDQKILQTFTAAREVLRPLRRSIQFGANVAEGETAGTGQDIFKLVDEGVSAVQRGDWNVVYRSVLGIRNGVAPLEAQKRDLRRVDLHPLEFVVFDFSSDFYAANPPPPPPPLTNTEVRLQRFPDERQPSLLVMERPGEAGATEVRDFAVVDFDLDAELELVVLTDREIVVLDRDATTGAWSALTRVLVSPSMRGLLVGDLDNDHKTATTTARNVAGPAVPPPDNDLGEPRGPAMIPDGQSEPTTPDAANQLPEVPRTHKADADVVVFGDDGVWVFENRLDGATGQRELIRIPQPDELVMPEGISAGILVDFDHDADLDLVLATSTGLRLWSSRGNLTFEDVTEWSSVPPSDHAIRQLIAVDWDRDVDIDLIVAGQLKGEAGFLENVLHGHFAWRDLGMGFERIAGTNAVAVAEFDGNVSWDLATVGETGVHVLLTNTTRPGRNQSWREIELSSDPFERVLVGDINNDTYPDLLVWKSGEAKLFLGGPDAEFQEFASSLPENLEGLGRGQFADVDLDGDLDWVVVQNGELVIYENEGGNQNNWLQVRAVGQSDNAGRAGHTGIGSLLELRSGPRYQADVVSSDVTHFGLGESERADALRIVWTNGVPQVVLEPAPNQVLTELMTLSGSCPYLYTWTGERFEFFTDCLWAAPIGMQVARGVVAPSRAWEYLKIPGDRLAPRDGHYELQITEELWEAAYFDRVELWAVDHPADVEIYSNEKVGPAEIAEFKIHTVRDARVPVAARDKAGRDVLPLVEAEDGQFFQGWEVQLHQGLTEEHYLELDLGPLDNPGQITLFLTGWIYPANTALNIAFAENPRLEGPRFPSVWTPNAQGEFEETRAFVGFPGGKTKTIAIDLSDAFLASDYRLQIRTSAQIYWDAAFFTVDEPAAELEVKKLPLETADLHYRGFSARVPYQNRSPEGYLYDQVSETPLWPPMRGHFTRYGDVRPLLLDTDDRLVVLGSGDEMTLRFAEPAEPPPPGWRRDFLLYSVGWDKDANLNTLHGQDVEPLPFVKMERYPYPSGREPSGPEFESYLSEYQTRQQNPLWFWRLLHARTPPERSWSSQPAH
jgi:hypothetical protein